MVTIILLDCSLR